MSLISIAHTIGGTSTQRTPNIHPHAFAVGIPARYAFPPPHSHGIRFFFYISCLLGMRGISMMHEYIIYVYICMVKIFTKLMGFLIKVAQSSEWERLLSVRKQRHTH